MADYVELYAAIFNLIGDYNNKTVGQMKALKKSIDDNYKKLISFNENEKFKQIEINGFIHFIMILRYNKIKIYEVISIFYYLKDMRYDKCIPSDVNFLWFMIGDYLSLKINSNKELNNLIEKIIELIPKFNEIFANSNNDVLYNILRTPVFVTYDMSPFTLHVQMSRLTKYYSYCCYVQNELEKISINGRIISNTNGDFHNGSRSPLFFKINNKEYVYKPRSFETEKVIDEIFHIYGGCKEINDLSPIPEIYGTSSFAYMEKVVYEKDMSVDEATNYVYKIGEMCYIVLLTGISDLHIENIIATKKGPMIIDGECVFDIDELSMKIGKDKYPSLIIGDLITGITKSDFGKIKNTMAIEVDKNRIQLCKTSKGNKKELTDYGKNLIKGFNEAKTKMDVHYLINCINKVVKKNLKSRYIVIKTEELNKVFHTKDYNELAVDIVNVIKTWISIKFQTLNYNWYLMEIEIFYKLKDIYERGDIPIFYFKYYDNKISILLENKNFDFCTAINKNVADIIIDLIEQREIDIRSPEKFDIEDLIKSLQYD